ncbi:uncharacterized protein HKW66_Vig0253510 [Vigna angularis]|uniref:Uncharacterized protein n=1 Tax=Phaseolus angularis TaxID=3914 RepID=A0A8T0K0T7_PHAAN|nr:uncharacterized protein HKW66_Vig0253510 [Vigna angularis]
MLRTRPRQRRIPRQRGWTKPSQPEAESAWREEVRAAEEAEEEPHDGVCDLLGARGVDVDEAKAEVSGNGRVDGAVGRVHGAVDGARR